MSFMQVPPQHLAEWLSGLGAQAQAVLLDVREPWELQTASVAQALPEGFRLVHVPMGELPSRLNELEPEVPTAVMCHHGVRSLQVGHWLSRQGFEQLANVHGGIDAWARDHDGRIGLY